MSATNLMSILVVLSSLLVSIRAVNAQETVLRRAAMKGDVSHKSDSGATRTWTFDRDPVGRVPAGWIVRETNPTTATALWKVVADPHAPSPPNVLALTKSENYDSTFNLAIARQSSFRDVDVTVKVKPMSGTEDQGGGPIWRCRDENNYYICRFNPLESNFRLYFVKNGRRKQLQSATIQTEPGTWYTIRVTMVGHRIIGYLDGKKLLEATDDTFPNAGMVGLWTKSDAVTRFDDLSVHPASAQETSLLALHQTIDLPGVKGRIDHLALDTTGQRLFLAARNNGSLEVVDLKAGRRVRSIRGLDEPQGIVYLPASGRVVVACGGDGTVRAFDTKTFTEIARFDLGEDADNIRWEASSDLLYVGFGDGALGVLETGRLTKRGLIELTGHPESFQLDPSTQRAYVNVPDAHEITVVNRSTRTVVERWSMAAAQSNYPMALDRAGHRLFVACRRPPRLLTIDTTSGATIASTECVGDADDLFFDAKRDRIYVVGGEGFIDVFTGTLTGVNPRLERVRTAPGARTAMLARKQGQLYVAVPEQAEQMAEVRIFDLSP